MIQPLPNISTPNEKYRSQLLEELTIDPRAFLPSFFEMNMVESAQQSGYKALKLSIDAIIAKLVQSSLQISSTTNSRLSQQQHIQTNNNNNNHRTLFWIQNLMTTTQQNIIYFLAHFFKKYKLEICMMLTYILERQFINNHCNDASITESMFSMKRSKVRFDSSSNSQRIKVEPLQKRDRIRCALFLALGPYIKEKMDIFFENERDKIRNNDNNNNNNNEYESLDHNQDYAMVTSKAVKYKLYRLTQKMRRNFVNSYPFIHMAYDGIIVAYNFAYLIGKSIYYNPSSHALGIVVRRVTMADSKQNSSSSSKLGSEGRSNNILDNMESLGISKSSIRLLSRIATISISSFIVASWIAALKNEIRQRRLRNMSSNHVENNGRNFRQRVDSKGQYVIPIPPPSPPVLLSNTNTNAHSTPDNCENSNTQKEKSKSPIQIQLPTDKSLCPLCHQKRINPVAAITSGFVFCYRCITLYMREHGEKCPLTGIYCKESQLVRVYESNDLNMMSSAIEKTNEHG